ncbi:MAG TPA: phosphotransferase [Gammaproteobacteria bacterium]|nr:phosphotransferase [Gammaproteobacteria bacterium]
MTSRPRDAAVRAALEGVLGADVARRATLQPLDGGVRQRSYVVSADGGQWVLRLPAPGADALLDLATEASVMRAAAAAGLAPDVVAVDAAVGILLTDYRAGARSWSVADAREPRNIERAAALLRALHALAVDAPSFAAERIARGYLDALSARGAVRRTRDARERGWADELLELARHYGAAHPPTALCHNDLVAANFLDDGRLVLVDFEYSARAAPVLDLAGLAGMNDYGARERRDLLAAYRGEDGLRIAESELEKIVRLVRLIAFFWARLGERRAAEPAAYSALAAELAERLC